MNVFTTEVRRFFARRFVRIMLAVVVGLFALVAIGTAVNYHRSSAADLANAQQQAASQQQQMDQQRAECQRDQASPNPSDTPFGRLPPGTTCNDMFPPDQAQAAWFLPEQWVLTDQAKNLLYVFAGLLALFAFSVGASFVGAEWSSGGMMNLLLWRPRRLPLLAGKLAALVAAVLTSAIALLAVWVGMLCLIALTRGSFGDVTAGILRSLALLGGRAIVLGLVSALVGFAVASIGRATAPALGIAIGYVIVIEAAGHLVFGGLMRLHHPEKYYLSTYFAAWLSKGATYGGDSCTVGSDGNSVCVADNWTVSMYHSATVLAVLAVALLTWAFVAFRRRDVT